MCGFLSHSCCSPNLSPDLDYYLSLSLLMWVTIESYLLLERIRAERGREVKQCMRKVVLRQPASDCSLLHVRPGRHIKQQEALTNTVHITEHSLQEFKWVAMKKIEWPVFKCRLVPARARIERRRQRRAELWGLCPSQKRIPSRTHRLRTPPLECQEGRLRWRRPGRNGRPLKHLIPPARCDKSSYHRRMRCIKLC